MVLSYYHGLETGLAVKHKEEDAFEIKKKAYSTPEIKEYGEFAEITKGNGNPGSNFDAGEYYNGDYSGSS